MLKTWNRNNGEIILNNGSRIKLFSADEPERFRGPQHHGAWCDELASYRYSDSWDQLQFGLRLGEHPRVIVTTTPKPTPLIRALAGRTDGSVVVTRGSTFDNAANLAPAALLELQARYNGTRLGRQELYGEILEDVEGALWTKGLIERARLPKAPPLSRITVSIDPAVTNTDASDETGIIVCGSDAAGHGYVLGDYSFRGSPLDWASKAVSVFDEWKADSILVEVNQIVSPSTHSSPLRSRGVWANEKVTRAVSPRPVFTYFNSGSDPRLPLIVTGMLILSLPLGL